MPTEEDCGPGGLLASIGSVGAQPLSRPPGDLPWEATKV